MSGSSRPVQQKRFEHLEDLRKYPHVISSPLSHPVIVVGDLNGNVLFAINLAIARGLLSLSDDPEEAKRRYLELVKIYNEFNEKIDSGSQTTLAKTKQYIARFKTILNEAKFNEHAQIFIGDTIADRGGLYTINDGETAHSIGNDYFTLYFFYQLLLSGKGQHSKIASNHDAQFFYYWQQYLNGTLEVNKIGDAYLTIKYFIKLIDQGFVTLDEAKKLVDVHKRSTKLFDYIYDEEAKTFELMVHAPCGLETVWAAARYYNLNSNDFGLTTWELTEDAAKKLSVTVIKNVIDHVNQEFLGVLLNEPEKFNEYISNVRSDEKGKYLATGLDQPVSRAMFNRVDVDAGQIKDQAEKRRLIVPQYIDNEVTFRVNHGHDGRSNIRNNMFNYNSGVGQSFSLTTPRDNVGNPIDVRNGIGSRLPVVKCEQIKNTLEAKKPSDRASVRSDAPSESTVLIHTGMATAQPDELKIKKSELTVFNEQRERLYTLLEEQQKSDKSILKKAEEISQLMVSDEMKSFLPYLQQNTLEDLILTVKIAKISPLSLMPFFARHLNELTADQAIDAVIALEALTEEKSQENFADLIPQTLAPLRELATSKAKASLTEIIKDYEMEAAKDMWHGNLTHKVELFRQNVAKETVEELVCHRILDTTGGFRDQSLNTFFLKKLANNSFLRKMLRVPLEMDLSTEVLKTPQGRQDAARVVKSVIEKSLGIEPSNVTTFSQSMRLGFPRV